MPRIKNANYPDDLKGIWKEKGLYRAFLSFWVKTSPKATIDFIRAGGMESGDKINKSNAHKIFEMSGLHNKKNILKLPSGDVSKINGMLSKGGHLQTDVKAMEKITKELHRLASLRSKMMAIPPFYKSDEFEAYHESQTF